PARKECRSDATTTFRDSRKREPPNCSPSARSTTRGTPPRVGLSGGRRGLDLQQVLARIAQQSHVEATDLHRQSQLVRMHTGEVGVQGGPARATSSSPSVLAPPAGAAPFAATVGSRYVRADRRARLPRTAG